MRKSRPRRASLALAVISFLAAACAAVTSCGGSGQNASTTGSGGGHGGTASTASSMTAMGGSMSTSSGGGSGGGGVDKNYPCAGCMPFPGDNAPECPPMQLGPAQLAYPPDGALFPPNMNVLEVQFVPPTGATLFEVDFENAITKVKVETKCNAVPDVRMGPSRGCGVTLPQQAWSDIANTNRDGDPVKITVRSTTDGKCVTTSKESVAVDFAKEDLAGGIYYWQSTTYGGIAGTTGGIYYHDFGTFDPMPTPFYTSGASGTCVGCHTLSRDGARIALETDDPDADDEFGDVHSHVLDVATRTVLGGKSISPGFQTFSHDHTKLIASTWKDAKNGAFDVFDGDGTALLKQVKMAQKVTQPDLSKDDKTLLYVVPAAGSIWQSGDHHFNGGSLYTSTFDMATNAIGPMTPFLAATGSENYYYPNLSSNQTFVVFNEANDASAANNDNDAFYNRKARVKLLHFPGAQGQMPIDLPKANLADGLTNSWPRWSPFVTTYKGKKLLWVTFSSNRDYGLHLVNKGFDDCYPAESPAYDKPQPASKHGVDFNTCAAPQIWMAGVIVDEDPKLDATDRSFPAFWLPFQDVNAHNHSAQWVEQVPMMMPDGGAPDSGSCGMLGAGCGGTNLCCADVVCCSGQCTDFSNCIK